MPRGSSARLFVALDPPPQVRGELAAWAREAAAALGLGGHGGREEGVRVLAEDSLHLTLCFLGSRPVGEIDALAAALREALGPVGALTVGPPLLLPPRRPRALAVEVSDDAGELDRLHNRVTGALAQVSGWTPERRRLRPHITVARMREGVLGRRRSATPIVFAPAPSLRFRPASVVLYRSRLDAAGARYDALSDCELPAAERHDRGGGPTADTNSCSVRGGH
jgi:2'-5' RNA ligase